MFAISGPGTSLPKAASSKSRDGALASAESLTDLGCLVARCFGNVRAKKRAGLVYVAAGTAEIPYATVKTNGASPYLRNGTNGSAGKPQHSQILDTICTRLRGHEVQYKAGLISGLSVAAPVALPSDGWKHQPHHLRADALWHEIRREALEDVVSILPLCLDCTTILGASVAK